MKKSAASKSLLFTAVSVGAICVGAWRAEAGYTQTDLVSDVSGLAPVTDPELVNPWGVSFLPGSPFWVSDQGTNVATLYAVTDSTNVSKVTALTVSIPTSGTGPAQGPTGQVANTNPSSFTLADGTRAFFIFANLNGTVSAWNPGNGTTATIESNIPGALYTGLAINQADTRLYAANGATGAVDVFNSSFAPVSLGSNAFKDPAISGLVPFNVQDLNGSVYVTYAPAGRPAQQAAALGQGAVAVFNEDGVLQKTLINGSSDQLAAPWGVALAPAGFHQFAGDLLVDNFSYLHSEINAYDPTTGAFVGTIPVNSGAGQTPGGLWALTFGGGGNDGDPNTLYFADGIDAEMHGLFGAITIPEPSTWVMMLAGFGGLGLIALRRSRSPLSTG